MLKPQQSLLSGSRRNNQRKPMQWCGVVSTGLSFSVQVHEEEGVSWRG